MSEDADGQQTARAVSDSGRPSLNIEFWNLSYIAPSGRKLILKSISGHFRPGELSAILGPSGAGKSTIMNILMGTLHTNVTGSILVNGQPRDMEKFNRQTTYIMQEDLLQPHISVEEAMFVTANLKMPSKCTRKEKLARIDEVLEMLDLNACRHVRTQSLSGGQRKRLSVALELVSNPPVVFLDEPTTGLDSVATKHMMKVLSLLASQGRTVVCSVHQPTASLLKKFDLLYVLARGQCVYQGEPRDLVPFLEDSGLHCPTTHNPADFILEVVQGDNAENIILLAGEMLNGKLNWRPSLMEREPQMLDISTTAHTTHKVKITFETTFLQQFYILLCRMLLQRARNKLSIALQIVYNVGISFLVGVLYYQRGNDGADPFTNFRFLLIVNVCFLYANMIIPTLCFPSELKLIQREYLNRWYGLKAFFMAHLMANIPAQIFLGIIFSVISYTLAGHPLEISRIILFTVFGITSGLISEGHGLVTGVLFSEVNGAILAPATIAPLLALSVVGMGYGMNVEPVMVVLRSISFMRYSLVGLTLSLYGMNRSELDCPDIYCHYQEPELFLRDLGMADNSMIVQFVVMSGFYTFYRVMAFLALRYRLSLEFSARLHAFVHRILRKNSSY